MYTDAVKISPRVSIFSSCTENCICPWADRTDIVGTGLLQNKVVRVAITSVCIMISDPTIHRGGRKNVIAFEATNNT